MQYRIVRRRDDCLDSYYYHIERRTYWWNNWIEIGDRCVTMQSADLQLQCYITEKEVLRHT